MFRSCVGSSNHVFWLIPHSSERRRLQGERFCWRIPFAGDVAFRNWALLDAEHGFPGVAVENEHKARLADGDQCGNYLSVLLDVDETRPWWQILIPQVMMDCLEI